MSLIVEDFVKPAIEQVFRTMLNTSIVHIPENTPSEQATTMEESQLASSIGFTGAFTGVLCLTMDEVLASAITKRLLQMDKHEEVTIAIVTDAIGELTNMIAGYVKTKLCDNKASTVMSVPTVVRGKNLNIAGSGNTQSRSLHFSCGRKAVLVQIITSAGSSKTVGRSSVLVNPTQPTI